MASTLILALVALAQAPDSTYDRLALRIGYGPGSSVILQGIEAPGVGGRIFIPKVELLAKADDSVRRHYNASRASFKRCAVLGGLWIVGAIATMEYYADRDHDWRPEVGIGLPLATVAVGWATQFTGIRGEDPLRRAIWLYNQRFPRTPDVATADCPYERCALRVRPGVWSTQIVRGASEKVLGSVNSRLDLFEQVATAPAYIMKPFVSCERVRTGRA
jgi:hypothetical protein